MCKYDQNISGRLTVNLLVTGNEQELEVILAFVGLGTFLEISLEVEFSYPLPNPTTPTTTNVAQPFKQCTTSSHPAPYTQPQGGASSTPYPHPYPSPPKGRWKLSLQRRKRASTRGSENHRRRITDSHPGRSGHHHSISHTITHSTSPCVYTSP
ncbi:hypothetical protein BJV78DRAFT_752973 [Lactifluus subvellereus]|nr:hypothetical protein BJV78DRAFT_752973 [Lactifluus subvellereus]